MRKLLPSLGGRKTGSWYLIGNILPQILISSQFLYNKCMKVSNSRSQQFLQNYRNKAKAQSSEAMPNQVQGKVEDKVELQIKKMDHFKVAKNDPTDPTVSTKVLDSLNSGMINFSQEQRDAIATIMSEKSKNILAQRNA
jgi:hypothetical protein